MKKIFLLFFSVLILVTSFGSYTPAPPVPNANAMFITVGNTGKKVSLMELSTFSLKEIESAKGQKMKFFEKLSFKLAQKKLKKKINADGTFKNPKFAKKIAASYNDTGFHLGGFALGFLVGLVGVLIAYLINDNYKSNRVKWAWIGLAAILAVYGLVIVLALNSVN